MRHQRRRRGPGLTLTLTAAGCGALALILSAVLRDLFPGATTLTTLFTVVVWLLATIRLAGAIEQRRHRRSRSEWANDVSDIADAVRRDRRGWW